MNVGTIFTGVRLADSALSKIFSKRRADIKNKIEAVRLLQRAVNNTRRYLVESKNNYKPNVELSDLWNDAFGAMLSVDKTLARRLNDKSRFWSNPEIWLVEEGTMELIPSLKELDEKCDIILVELENRI